MKKVIALLVCVCLIILLTGCGKSTQTTPNIEPTTTNIKVGMVCIGDDNAAYDRNFYSAAAQATELLAQDNIVVEWVYTYNHPEGDAVASDCIDLADDGCKAVFLNSYGQEPAMLTVAADYPDTIFCALTNESSKSDDLANTVNAFPSVYEGRYLAGVAAGMKLNEMIETGIITEDEAVIGYVGAYTYAEVLSGYTAFFLGAQSVCPSATMLVEFIGSWGDPTMEAATAQDLIDRGAVLISQHSDSTTPATVAQENGVFHVGYNIDMSDIAPEASIISSRIDWTNYFVYIIRSIVNGEEIAQDYMNHGVADGDVVLTTLNDSIAAVDTQITLDEIQTQLINGELHVFDINSFTVNGEHIEEAFLDMNADFAPDDTNAVFDGYYHESYFKSAPNFDLRIDGITLVNEQY